MAAKKKTKKPKKSDPPKRPRGRPRKYPPPDPETANLPKKMGRPQAPIDWDQVNEMCRIHCTAQEICAVTGISDDTFLRRCKKEHGMTFAEYIENHRADGKASLRRTQVLAAQTGSVPMMIWLGKNWLDQRDRTEQEITHKGDLGPIVLPQNDRDS